MGLWGGIPGLIVSDTANNRVLLERGGLEAGLREVRAVVADWKESREGGAGLSGRMRRDAAQRLSARVVKGSVFLMGARDQRILVESGREGLFDLGGKPEMREARAPEGPAWWERDPEAGSVR